MDPLFQIPEDFSTLSDDELASFIETASETVQRVRENPDEYVGEHRTADELVEEMREGIAALRAAKEVSASRTTEPNADLAAQVEALAAEAEGEGAGDGEDAGAAVGDGEGTGDGEGGDAGEGDGAGDGDGEGAADGEGDGEGEGVQAAATPAPRQRLRAPARARSAEPRDSDRIAMTATAGGLGVQIGDPLDRIDLAKLTRKAREQFGRIPPGTKGEKVGLAAFDIRPSYPEERTLTAAGGSGSDLDKIQAATDPELIRRNFDERRAQAEETPGFVASGGLCAPVTPYYNLQMISVPDRPVRAALPAFNADRGGINAARPLSLADIDTAVGVKTASQDKAGGTTAAKTCQVVDCPDFEETDVRIVYHCVQFGNLGARTFPERVAQANDLVLSAHSRVAEAQLLTDIAAVSTAVTAASLGLGIVGDLLGQILVAAAGMRSRHRMDPEAVLRVMIPDWVLDEFQSDVYRSQFQRFDMSEDDFVRLLREAGIEPTFYIDGAAGAGQVFGAQNPGHLLPFPSTVHWYIYPEGSFLYLDGGVLELGIVRDSILNQSNDFQIFGESFEAVAFVGVESLAVTSTVCDSGTVALPQEVNCPITYA